MRGGKPAASSKEEGGCRKVSLEGEKKVGEKTETSA